MSSRLADSERLDSTTMTHDKKLHAWLKGALVSVARGEADHIHIDELVDTRTKSAADILRAVRESYESTIRLLSNNIDDVMPVLVIPLTSTNKFTRTYPSRSEVVTEMSDEPPSIYVVPRGAGLLRIGELYRVYLPAFDLFDEPREDVTFFYEIFRGEKERAWRWEYTRSILGEHYSAKQRTGWNSSPTS